MSFREFYVKSPFNLNLLYYETPVMRSPIVAVGLFKLLMTCIIIPTILSVILVPILILQYSYISKGNILLLFASEFEPS
jgi:hypothetical protein